MSPVWGSISYPTRSWKYSSTKGFWWSRRGSTGTIQGATARVGKCQESGSPGPVFSVPRDYREKIRAGRSISVIGIGKERPINVIIEGKLLEKKGVTAGDRERESDSQVEKNSRHLFVSLP